MRPESMHSGMTRKLLVQGPHLENLKSEQWTEALKLEIGSRAGDGNTRLLLSEGWVRGTQRRGLREPQGQWK